VGGGAGGGGRRNRERWEEEQGEVGGGAGVTIAISLHLESPNGCPHWEGSETEELAVSLKLQWLHPTLKVTPTYITVFPQFNTTLE